MDNDKCRLADEALYFYWLSFFRRIPHASMLMVLTSILMGVAVGIGSYAPRYRRHPIVGLLFIASTVLFLPIVSVITSAFVSDADLFPDGVLDMVRKCLRNPILVILWSGFVMAIGINTSTVVATDAREDRSTDPSIEQLIKAIWLAYLVVSRPTGAFHLLWKQHQIHILHILLFAMIFMKLVLRYSLLFKARRSFALGRSPRFVAGYMAQLQLQQQQHQAAAAAEQPPPPPPPPSLVVMGEDAVKVEKQCAGYSFKGDSSRLVTIDRVWRRLDLDGMSSTPDLMEPKDLCFSFALFKLLRCRFAKYTVSEAGFMQAHEFFQDTYICGADYERAFQVISTELSFIHDYYYTSLPIYYSHHLLTLMSVALSLYTIGYCLFVAVLMSREVFLRSGHVDHTWTTCGVSCFRAFALAQGAPIAEANALANGGVVWYSISPVFVALVLLVAAVLVLSEMRDIVSYVSSNWTKIALVCAYGNRTRWQQSPAVKKCIGFVLKYCRCKKLVDSWDDRMNQCSLLVHRPWRMSICLRRLLGLPDQNVKVPSAVKKAIFTAVEGLTTSDQEGHAPKAIRPPSSLILASFADDGSLPARYGKDTAYTILSWHIATSVFEVRHPQAAAASDAKIAATRLSRYCAYLVAYRPDLLPSDDEWCKKLYRDAKKDAAAAAAAGGGRVVATAASSSGAEAAEYLRLAEALSAESKHAVVKDGAKLAVRLVESGTTWEALASFWSGMLLYVAPSENLQGHADAIARGGELITLLWALLAHAGFATSTATL